MKNIVVVSLTNQYERRQHIDTLFKEYEIDFEYFNAIDRLRVAETLKKYELYISSEKLSTGEVACYLSHYCLWQQVIESDMSYLMIFEDDIYFSEDAKTLLKELNWLPNNFDIIKLETMYQRVMINKGVNLPLAHKLCQMKSRHMGTAGYIISQKGAEKLIAMTHSLGINQPVDQSVFKSFIEHNGSKVYQVFPALCIQDQIYNNDSAIFRSELEEIRETKRKLEIKPSGYKKVSREWNKIVHQLHPKNIYHAISLIVRGYKKQKIEYRD